MQRYAKLSKTAGFAKMKAERAAAAGGKGAKAAASKAAKSATGSAAGREYWFKGADNTASKAKKYGRAKLVNLDAYNVVKGKEGWLEVKDKAGKKAQQWVVREPPAHHSTSTGTNSRPLYFY